MTATLPIDDRAPTTALPSATEDTRVWIGTIAIIFVGYLLLQNPYWVPAGDSEVYIATARNLAMGKGNLFNGQPAVINPPGWPLILAGLMRISPQFLFLKLANMSLMVAALAAAYRICRRFATPKQAAAVVLLAAIISNVYQCSFWLVSESAFCFTSAISILLAMQIAEDRRWKWRLPLLIVLCSVNILIRWAGVFTWLLVAAALLEGEFWPKLNRRWVGVALTALVAAGTFLGTRAALRISPEQAAKASEFGGSGEEATLPLETPDSTVATAYTIFNAPTGGSRGYFGRAEAWGDWISYLFWQPFRIGSGGGHIARWLDRGALLAGWLLLSSVLIRAGIGAMRRQWFWPAVVLYSLALAMMWTKPNARYLVPLAPFFLLGIFQGTEFVFARSPLPWVRRTGLGLLIAFVTALLLCNGALYAVEVKVARSGNFYGAYEAGLDADLIAASRWLREHDAADGQIAVSFRYINYGRARMTEFGLRVTNMLTDKAIVRIPDKYLTAGNPGGRTAFAPWAHYVGVKYYLYQPEVSPWRVFHFRMGWLQELMTKQPVVDSHAGWQLNEVPESGGRVKRIPLEPSIDWPTRVPGM